MLNPYFQLLARPLSHRTPFCPPNFKLTTVNEAAQAILTPMEIRAQNPFFISNPHPKVEHLHAVLGPHSIGTIHTIWKLYIRLFSNLLHLHQEEWTETLIEVISHFHGLSALACLTETEQERSRDVLLAKGIGLCKALLTFLERIAAFKHAPKPYQILCESVELLQDILYVLSQPDWREYWPLLIRVDSTTPPLNSSFWNFMLEDVYDICQKTQQPFITFETTDVTLHKQRAESVEIVALKTMEMQTAFKNWKDNQMKLENIPSSIELLHNQWKGLFIQFLRAMEKNPSIYSPFDQLLRLYPESLQFWHMLYLCWSDIVHDLTPILPKNKETLTAFYAKIPSYTPPPLAFLLAFEDITRGFVIPFEAKAELYVRFTRSGEDRIEALKRFVMQASLTNKKRHHTHLIEILLAHRNWSPLTGDYLFPFSHNKRMFTPQKTMRCFIQYVTALTPPFCTPPSFQICPVIKEDPGLTQAQSCLKPYAEESNKNPLLSVSTTILRQLQRSFGQLCVLAVLPETEEHFHFSSRVLSQWMQELEHLKTNCPSHPLITFFEKRVAPFLPQGFQSA